LSRVKVRRLPLPQFSLWEKLDQKNPLLSLELEITARCNNDCRHCYINLPADDRRAKSQELTLEEIGRLADEAVSLGALWGLLTGGEPLLREDFSDIYMLLKKKGLLLTVFTNACLIGERHARLFKSYPPREIEVSVYGVTRETYEAVTRKPGSFRAFKKGLDLLIDNGIKVRLKAMLMRSNVHEFPAIAAFCRERTKDYFRFDPLLHLRYDGNEKRNEEIRAERLSAAEIAAIERNDPERFRVLKEKCADLITPDAAHTACGHLFHCGAGEGQGTISYDGWFKLCSSLCHPACVYNLRKGRLADAYLKFVREIREMRSSRPDFLKRCRTCSLLNLCHWCPAHAALETGELDAPVDYFCEVAHARARSLKEQETWRA
jgi:radical SAM protein with 4Fe4S-binding SPASM domain